MYVCSVYLLGIYKYTHMHVYISEKICYGYIKYIYLEKKLYEYKYRHVNIFKTYCVCIFIYT